jgi:hypothetical protein
VFDQSFDNPMNKSLQVCSPHIFSSRTTNVHYQSSDIGSNEITSESHPGVQIAKSVGSERRVSAVFPILSPRLLIAKLSIARLGIDMMDCTPSKR